jgi:hypothetical protein
MQAGFQMRVLLKVCIIWYQCYLPRRVWDRTQLVEYGIVWIVAL